MRLLLLCTFALLSFNLFAQLEPVTWSFDVEKVNESEYEVIFTADIDRGWSVYSQFMENQDGPIPTSFEFYNTQIVGKAREIGNKKEIYDQMFDMKLVKLTGKAKFMQRVKVESKTKKLTGHLTYMTCDDESCLPPTDVNFEINIEGE